MSERSELENTIGTLMDLSEKHGNTYGLLKALKIILDRASKEWLKDNYKVADALKLVSKKIEEEIWVSKEVAKELETERDAAWGVIERIDRELEKTKEPK